MYDVNNFIAPYTSFDKTLKILLPNGEVSFSLFVCNYQKAFVKQNFLNIVLEDRTKVYSLEFLNNSQANTAFLHFKTAIDLLKNNCEKFISDNPTLYYAIDKTVKPKLVKLNDSSINIFWDEIPGGVYEIEYNIFGDILSMKKIKNIIQNNYTITDLEPNTSYEIKVRTINEITN